MVKRTKTDWFRSLSCSALLALLCCGGTAMAEGIPAVYYNGSSEQEIGARAGSDAIKSVRATFEFLPRTFTDAEIRTAGGIAEVERLQREYKLGAKFDSEQLAHAMGLERIAWLHRELPVQATIRDLAVWQAKSLVDMLARSHKGLRNDFSYDDYIRVIGGEVVASWNLSALPADFTYADLVKVLGPSSASALRRLHGFSKGAGHAEIVRACGIWSATRFVGYPTRTFDFINLKIDAGASASQILDAFVASELQQLEQRFGPNPDRSLAAALGHEQLKSYAKLLKLPDSFDQTNLEAAAGEAAVQQLRDRYDLDEHFNDADIAAAAAASAQANERILFKLAPGFTAAQDAEARKR